MTADRDIPGQSADTKTTVSLRPHLLPGFRGTELIEVLVLVEGAGIGRFECGNCGALPVDFKGLLAHVFLKYARYT